MAWAFFIMIIIAIYTTNLAAFLSQKNKIYNISSINDCLAQNYLTCFQNSYALESLSKELYPNLRYNNSYTHDALHLMIHDLREGKCDAVLISKYHWNSNPAFWGECDVTLIGNFVLQFKVAIPVSDTISKAITYWIGKKKDQNEFVNILRKHQPDHTCDNFVVSDVIKESKK